MVVSREVYNIHCNRWIQAGYPNLPLQNYQKMNKCASAQEQESHSKSLVWLLEKQGFQQSSYETSTAASTNDAN